MGYALGLFQRLAAARGAGRGPDQAPAPRAPDPVDTLAVRRVQTGAPSQGSCPACRSARDKPPFMIVDYYGTQYFLYTCPDCGSRIYDPPPVVDYRSEEFDDSVLKDYVEASVEIWLYCVSLARVMEGRAPGTYLDVGCSYGFAVDIARTLFGYDVVGVEPSRLGKLGAEQLKFPLFNDYLTKNHPLVGKKFDVVCSSEVIEHVADPEEFVALLKDLVADDGVLFLTTPTADYLDDAQRGVDQLMAHLSPGAHTVLFTEKSLTALLKRGGFPHVKIHDQLGHLFCYASRLPLRLADEPDAAAVSARYYKAALDRFVPHSLPHRAVGARYFTQLVNAGAYEEADAIWRRLGITLPARLPPLRRYTDFLDTFPACACRLAYHRGMLLLNGKADAAQAAQVFALSFQLARSKISLARHTASEECFLFWHIRYHHALALYHAGELAGADRAIGEVAQQELRSAYDPSILPPSDDLAARAGALQAEIRAAIAGREGEVSAEVDEESSKPVSWRGRLARALASDRRLD